MLLENQDISKYNNFKSELRKESEEEILNRDENSLKEKLETSNHNDVQEHSEHND